MKKNVMVAAVAAAFVAPAFAQSSVTVGGTINIMWDSVRANGATSNNVAGVDANIKSHDRVRDGAGSNIRFTVIEDLGGGNSAFVQVESAVIMNSDTRANQTGTNSGIGTAGNNTAIWGNRNSGIGIRSKTAGRFLIGVWDVHYHEHYNVDPGWIIANSANSTLAMTQNLGSAFSVNPAMGGRLGNVIRWDSPVWGGFSMSVAYARPTDGIPTNTTGAGGTAASGAITANSVAFGKKNRVWNFAPRYESGGLTVQYSYMSDKDSITTATLTFGGNQFGAAGLGTGASVGGAATSTWKLTSNRLGARYKFANGLGIGALWDSSKAAATHEAGIGATSIKRTSWAFPVTYETGNHHVYGTYGRSRDWKGQLAGNALGTAATNVTVGTSVYSLANDTGAKYWTFGYAYKLSQRTNVHVSYMSIKNEALARYDGFANTFGTGAAQFGADPRSIAFGLRHTF